jgi:two-component system response regulator YesN
VAKQAKLYIDNHYANEDFSMNVLSKELLVNQTYLRKMFKNELGMTITDYLLKVRMDHAKDLIMDAYYKLSAISELVGYKDPGYFSKCFKKYYGVSPSDYSEIQS